MIKSVLIEIPQVVQEIKRDARQAGISSFPKVDGKLFVWGFYTGLTQSSYYDALAKKYHLRFSELCRTQKTIDLLTVKFILFLTLLAYDDPFDRINVSKLQIYEQLARCFSGFLIGAFCDFPLKPAHLLSMFGRLHASIKDRVSEDVWLDLEKLLKNNDFINSIRYREKVERNDLLYETNNTDYLSLNITIYSAINLGITYKQLKSKLLNPELKNSDENTNWPDEFILTSFLKSGFAQANTASQMAIADIDFKKYIRIACWKSNAFLDIGGCIRSGLVRSRLLEARFSKARFCEQLLDDIFDYDDDANEGILNFINLRLIEQGRLAQKIIGLFKTFAMTDQEFMDQAAEMIEDSCLLKTAFEEIYIFQNPLLNVERDVDISDNNRTFRKILMEIFVNSPEEIELDIETLLMIRIHQYEKFVMYWTAGNYEKCSEIVVISSNPSIMIHSLIVFVKATRTYAIRKSHMISDMLCYYCMLLASLHFYLLKFTLKKHIIILKNRITGNYPLEGEPI
jgi:hypothetical protein